MYSPKRALQYSGGAFLLQDFSLLMQEAPGQIGESHSQLAYLPLWIHPSDCLSFLQTLYLVFHQSVHLSSLLSSCQFRSVCACVSSSLYLCVCVCSCLALSPTCFSMFSGAIFPSVCNLCFSLFFFFSLSLYQSVCVCVFFLSLASPSLSLSQCMLALKCPNPLESASCIS